MLTINAVSDAIKAFAQSLQLAFFLPSLIAVTINAYFVVPQLWPSFKPDDSPTLLLTIVVTMLLSYALYAFNFPLIRLVEGYKFLNSDIGKALLDEQTKEFKDLQEQLSDLKFRRAALRRYMDREARDADPNEHSERLRVARVEEWHKVSLDMAGIERRLDTQFPPESLLPTQFGNSIAAFEDYPRSRYGIDAIALWPRLVPILKEKDFMSFVTQEKSVLDFLLNMGVVALLLGCELFYLNLYWGYVYEALLIALSTTGICLLLYQAMIVAARQWGGAVRVAFDLYRYDLGERLGMKPAASFEDERGRWLAISQFLLYRRERITFTNFVSQEHKAAQPPKDKK